MREKANKTLVRNRWDTKVIRHRIINRAHHRNKVISRAKASKKVAAALVADSLQPGKHYYLIQ